MIQAFSVKNCHLTASKSLRVISNKLPFKRANRVSRRSLEFGTAVLGAKVLYVLGYSNCGAVAATFQADDVPGQISGLFQHIR